MPNHLHIVLIQAARTLGWILQSVLRRIALLVHKTHDVRGHVFERTFGSKWCSSSDYLRNAILYTHRNPIKARLCDAAGMNSWTSHRAFCLDDLSAPSIQFDSALPLFAAAQNRTLAEARDDYVAYFAWWCRRKLALEAGSIFNEPAPSVDAGDKYFDMRHRPGLLPAPPTGDLRDSALRIAGRIDPTMGMEALRRPYGTRRTSEVRNQLIAGLLTARYPGVAIANYLRVSQSTVSRISTAMRWLGTSQR